MPSTFHEHETKSGLKDRRRLSAFIDTIIREHLPEAKKVRLSYIFCNDDYLLQINRQFLEHDTFTDIITFDLSEDDGNLSGEIYISVERVRENARQFEVAYPDELQRVIFHGALHLCGFKDKTAKDQDAMRAQENSCITRFRACSRPRGAE